jgi:hypothetical protein
MNFLFLFQQIWRYLPVVFVVALGVSLFFFPGAVIWLSVILFFSSLGMTALLIVQKQILPYKQGQVTRVKFMRSVLLDLLGLLVVIGVASYLGGRAGVWLGAKFAPSVWAGIVAGMTVGLVSAWGAGKVWKKISKWVG